MFPYSMAVGMFASLHLEEHGFVVTLTPEVQSRYDNMFMAHDDTAYELFCHCYRDCPRTKFPQPLLASEARPALASISWWAPAAPACAGDSSTSSLHASILSFRLQSILRNRRCSGRVKMKCFKRPTQELLRRLTVVWLARSRLCNERVSLPHVPLARALH